MLKIVPSSAAKTLKYCTQVNASVKGGCEMSLGKDIVGEHCAVRDIQYISLLQPYNLCHMNVAKPASVITIKYNTII